MSLTQLNGPSGVSVQGPRRCDTLEVILTPSWVVGISLAVQLVYLWQGSKIFPKAQPVEMQEKIIKILGVITLLLTYFEVPIFRSVLSVPPLILAPVLIALAVSSPLEGRREAKKYGDPEIFQPARFVNHIRTNLLGAAAAVLFIIAARWTPGLGQAVVKSGNEAALNIVLPIVATVAFAFVRSQQVEKCPDLDQRLDRGDANWEAAITGVSLRHMHQRLNVAHLIVVMSTIATSILFMLSYTLKQARNATPSELSPILAAAFALLLLFLAACGLPAMRQYKAVYWTFLTGTPVAVTVILIWLLSLRDDHFRNLYGSILISVSFIVYGVLSTRGGIRKGRGDSEVYFYFVPILLVPLIVVTGGLYLSN